jgi:hypothetical protein
MATISLFKMKAPQLDAEMMSRIAQHLRMGGKPAESDEASIVQDKGRVLVRADACAKLAGVLLYVNHASSLGAVHEKPIGADRAAHWLGDFLEKHKLGPGKTDDTRARVEVASWSRTTEAVVFDGKERKRLPARTDAGLRMTLNGLPISGPRTRVRAVFGTSEIPLMVHVAVWERLEHHDDAELVREHEVVETLERSMRGRTECNLTPRIRDVRLEYAASEEFHGRPDLLAPYYFVEVESPFRGAKADAQAPRQLMKIPAWRSVPSARPSELPRPS